MGGALRDDALRETFRGAPAHPRFDIVRALGEGAYGTVFEAFDRERGERVALKRLSRTSPEAFTAFKREFRTLAGLVHPGLPRLHELFVHDGVWFFSMELVDGADLRLRGGDAIDAETRTLTDGGALVATALPSRIPRALPSRVRVRAILASLVDILGFVHRAGFVHCDVKPSNVRVTPGGRVVLVDFGLACRPTPAQGSFGGTLAYAAPEQLLGELSAEVDLYALGSLAYELLSGAPPFGFGEEAAENKQRRAPLPLDLPLEDADLGSLVVGLLSRVPRARTSALARYTASAPSHGALASRELRTFVGREDVVARVLDAFDRSRDAVVVVAVEGTSGIGKSSLLGEVERRLTSRSTPFALLHGRASECEHLPWNLFDGVADGLGAIAAPGSLAPVLGRAFPVLRTKLGGAEETSDLALAFRAALRALGHFVLLLDDVQWADADSLGLLASILARPEPPPCLVVLARRPAARRLELAHDVETISLGPLSPEETRALLEARGSADIEGLVVESQGHPLFVEELVRANRDEHARTLDGVLSARLTTLDPSLRRVLDVLALATEPLTARAIAAILGEDLEGVAHALDRLREGRFARLDDAPAAVRHALFHDRLGDRIRAELTSESTARIHERVVRWLSVQSDAEPEAMCHHLRGAGRGDEARSFALAAADRAERAMAFERAARFYESALALGDDREVRLRRAAALRKAQLSVEAADELVRIAELDDASSGIALRVAAARLYISSGELARGQALLASLLARSGDAMPGTHAAANVALARERALLAVELRLPDGAHRLRRVPFEQDRLVALRAVAEGLGMIDTLRAAVFHTRAVRVGLRSRDPLVRAELLAIEAIFLGNASRSGRRRARALVDRARMPFGAQVPARIAAFVDAVTAMNERSQRPSHANLTRFKDVESRFEAFGEGDAWVVWSLRLSRSRGARILGDLNEMRELYSRFLPEADRQRNVYASVTLRRSHSLLHLAANEPARSRRLLDETRWEGTPGSYHIQDWLDLEARIEIDLYEGREASLTQEQWQRLWRSTLHYGDTQRAIHLYVRGRLLSASRSHSDTHVRIEIARTVRRLADQREGYALTMARAIRAGLAARLGRWADALQELRAVRRLAARYEQLSLGASAALLIARLSTGTERADAEVTAARFHREHGVVRPEAWARLDFPAFGPLLERPAQSATTKLPSSA